MPFLAQSLFRVYDYIFIVAMGCLSVIVNLSCRARNEVLCYLPLFFQLFALFPVRVNVSVWFFSISSASDVFQDGLWKNATAFKDPQLISLSSGLQSSVLSARALGTTGSYARAFQKWKLFAQSKSELSFFPADPLHVATYLQFIIDSTRSLSSVDAVFHGIKWAHDSAGIDSPTDNP